MEKIYLSKDKHYIRLFAQFAPLILVILCGMRIAVTVRFLKPFVGSNAVEHYLPIADRILEQSRFNDTGSRPDSKIPLAYPLFLAAAKATSNKHQLLITICVQAIADLICALGIYYFAKRHIHPTAGALAGFLWLLFPPAVSMSCYIAAETFFTCVFTLAVLLFMHGLFTAKPATIAWSGMLLGVATLLRGTPLFLLPLLGMVIWCFKPQRSLLTIAVVFASMAIIVVPWTIRNWIVLDDFIPVHVGFGSVVMQGADEKYFTGEGKTREYPELFRSAIQSGLIKPPSGKESEIDNWLMKIGWFRYHQRWEQQPGSFPPFILHKFFRLWYGTESGSLVKQIGLGLCSIIVLPLAIVQLWRLRATNKIVFLTVATIIGYFVVLHLVGLPEFRYVFPLFPILLLLASNTILEIWSYVKYKRRDHSPA